ANVYAVNASTGALLWKTKVDDHPMARVTGSPRLHQGCLYVPVSSVEEVSSGNPKYECCKFRGSVVALDVGGGKQIWKTYTIPDPPTPAKKKESGVQLYGPSGAAVWSAPTLDLKRKALYVGTGNSYSDPPARTSEAVLAIDMESGSMLWSKQLTPGSVAWNFACFSPDRSSCPEKPGQDFDFGSSPILKDLPGGKSVLVCGQKSGVVHALDPDRQGEIVWQVRIGHGSALGGIQWGPAADDQTAYVALSDVFGGKPEDAGGLFALRLASGEKVWHAPPPKPPCLGQPGCSAAQSAAVTAIPGAVFSGSLDGHLRAYSTADGSILWDFDTVQEFPTVNGVKAKGGSINGPGPTIAGGMVYVNSGYGRFREMPGNVLLAFSVDGK
ncbi:MAG: PQQ-binding-like beta-propeller repeat protein, partial [Acidobacteria bacterium]|nr:PQQ-binding-like beta-propeller repeat protein [Acidobacteriota bacterium]